MRGFNFHWTNQDGNFPDTLALRKLFRASEARDQNCLAPGSNAAKEEELRVYESSFSIILLLSLP